MWLIYVEQINMMQGSVDVSFRVKGSKAAGTLYFTSIRRSKGTQFSIRAYLTPCSPPIA